MKKRIKKIILVILLVIIITLEFMSQGLKMQYKKEVKTALGFWSIENPDLLTKEDIASLPEPVQKYINYVGAIGKPKIWNYRIEMKGKMWSDEEKKPMSITSVQYNFTKNPLRMFYIKGNMMGLPVYGLHSYKNEEGKMQIKVLGLLSVVNATGVEMDISDTVTLLNDMCVFAPGALIDKRIQWEPIDELTTKATFTNGKNTVSAILYFNEEGQLINFISDDRYAIGKTTEKLRWSTPITKYINYSGVNLPANAKTIWHYPDREFTYGDFDVVSVVYNVTDYK